MTLGNILHARSIPRRGDFKLNPVTVVPATLAQRAIREATARSGSLGFSHLMYIQRKGIPRIFCSASGRRSL
jgi:hypothetical protein